MDDLQGLVSRSWESLADSWETARAELPPLNRQDILQFAKERSRSDIIYGILAVFLVYQVGLAVYRCQSSSQVSQYVIDEN